MIATIAVLSVGLLASSALWWRSEQQRRTAQMQAARAEAVTREHARLARINLDVVMKDRSLIEKVPGLVLMSS